MKGCFIYLVNHTEQAVKDGERSLALLWANYLQRFTEPVVLFHEEGLTDGMKDRLRAACPVVVFVQVDFSGYPVGKKITSNGSWSLGYLHMCHFFANEVFCHPILDQFDYVCRLDTDSFILAPIAYDLFEFAWDKKIVYGFLNDELVAPQEYCWGLRESATKFAESRPGFRTYRDARNLPEGGLYYTNFEICLASWFRVDPWRAFFNHVQGGIYTSAWGDHVIRYVGVKIFAPPSRVRQLPGIVYSHQGIGASHVA